VNRQASQADELSAVRAALALTSGAVEFCPSTDDPYCLFLEDSASLMLAPSETQHTPVGSNPDDLGRVTHALAGAVRQRLKIKQEDLSVLRALVSNSKPTANLAVPLKPPAQAPGVATEATSGGATSQSRGIGEANDSVQLVQRAVSRVHGLAVDKTFAGLTTDVQAALIRGLAESGPAARTVNDLSRVDTRTLYEQFGAVSGRWSVVVRSEETLLRQANESMIATEGKLASAQDSLDSEYVKLDDLAQKIAHYNGEVTTGLKSSYFTAYARLTRNATAYRGMLNGMVPPGLVSGSPTAFNATLVAAASQLVRSGDDNARLISNVVQAAAGDLGSVVGVLAQSGVHVEALGISIPPESLLSVAQGKDPLAALAAPLLSSVGLPPQLGTIAVGLSTGNVFAAVGGLASLGGFFGGGSSSDPAVTAALGKIQEQLGAIRESLARIESRLDKIEAKLDEIERQMQANHATVMARLEVLGEQLVAVNDLALAALQSNTGQCNPDWVQKYDYERLRSLLNSSKVDDYRACFQALKKSVPEQDLSPLFRLSVTQPDPYAKQSLIKVYFAPHYEFLRLSIPPTPDARNKAVALLGQGDGSIASLLARIRGLEPSASLSSRSIFSEEILRPDHLVAAIAVDKFVNQVLATTSLRPFINLAARSKMVTRACAHQQSCLTANKAGEANPIEIEDLLRRTLRVVDTGVAQASILDGDLAIPHAVDVLTVECAANDTTCSREQVVLAGIMTANEIYAKNVAHFLLRTLFEAKHNRGATELNKSRPKSSLEDSYLYSFAVASGSAQLLSRVFELGGDNRWKSIRFFRRDEAEGLDCSKLWEGEGLYVKVRNGVCVPVPAPTAFAQGALEKTHESQVLQRDRAALIREISAYSAKQGESSIQRVLIDRMILSQ